MKRSWIKRGTSQLKRTPLKRGTKGLRRTKLRVVGHSTMADLKKEIQALVRSIAIIRDGGCVLRHFPEAGACGGYRNDGELILQAEHLVTRSNSATFGDMRNIVCLCRHHHGHFKPQYSRLYWDLIREHVGEDRWNWVRRVEADKTPYKVDWKLTKLALQQELNKLSTP